MAAAEPVVLAGTAELKPLRWVAFAGCSFFAAFLLAIPAVVAVQHGRLFAWTSSFDAWMCVVLGLASLSGALRQLFLRQEVRYEPANGEIVGRSGVGFAPDWTRTFLSEFDRVTLQEIQDNRDTNCQVQLAGARRKPLPLTADLDVKSQAQRVAMRAAVRTGLPLEVLRFNAGRILIPAAEIARRVSPQDLSGDLPWWRQPAAYVLLAANLVPLAGVLYFRWDLLALLTMFWLDTAAIGLIALSRILLAQRDRKAVSGLASMSIRVSRALKFVVMYGVFTLGQGFFLLGFGAVARHMAGQLVPPTAAGWLELLSFPEVAAAAFAVVASRAVDFYLHYLRQRAYERADVEDEAGTPFGRAVLLYFVIILGGGAALLMESPVALLALLVLLKASGDLHGFVERYRARANLRLDALLGARR